MNTPKTLVIVESPSKCKKIESYLGTDYKVIASYGHFTKLDSLDQIHFDTFQITYKVDKGKVLKTIKEEIKKCKEVILATDDDREGEAIAWSLCTFCKLDLKKTKKIVFQEITKPALTRALENIGIVNMDRVKSQQARQILDIYLGYNVSPLLWKYVQHTLSAGRCQTPALRLVYENQKECDSMNDTTHFTIKALLTSKRIPFQFEKHVEKENIENFMEMIQHQEKWYIETKKERQIQEKPPRIFITSSLQQKAHSLLKYSPKMTMKYAQELYENGYITYMRTDSACYSLEFIDKVKTHIIKEYGESYVHENIQMLHVNTNKGKAQEAHEGIRVCDLKKEKSNLKTKGANTLYDFIYKHTIQCAMSIALFKETKFTSSFEDYGDFIHRDKCCIFKGWTLLNKDKEQLSYVPYLTHLYDSKTPCLLQYAEANETFVQTKSHYHEASLIQKLEALNIGRPSTYASILQNLLDKKYVIRGNVEGKHMNVTQFVFQKPNPLKKNVENKVLHVEKNKLVITPLGIQVCEFCYKHFDKVFQYDFTNDMESKLDKIEWGHIEQHIVLKEYIQVLDTWIHKTKDYYKENPTEVNKVKDQSLHCGKYKNQPLYIKNGKFGYYLCIGKKDKISLNEFNGFCISKKIDAQEDLQEEEIVMLHTYINNRNNIRNESIIVELSNTCSIRKSKYGYYIFYKKKDMKKPTFLKFNDEKDEKNEERMRWIETQDKNKIATYIMKKYNINI